MISDKRLIYLSLAVSVAGLISLAALTITIEPKRVKISEITSETIGQETVAEGLIGSYFAKDGHVFITLEDKASIKVVMFLREAEKQPWVYDLRKGDAIEVTGRVQLYKNELEIVASSIRVSKLS